MTPEVAEVFREVLASAKPLPYGPAAPRGVPAAVAEQFSIRSQIQMALRPKMGSPWAMGLHHCAQPHVYDEDELLLFNDIGQRVADALSSMTILKNLRASEESLNRAQAVGQIGSWLLDIPTNRLEWSAETYRMFGAPQQKGIDLETFDATVHLDDRDFVTKAWGEAMAGAPYDIEHRIVVGGQTRWVRERAQIERDPEGHPLTGIGTVQDITERKQVEEKLRASEQKFMRLFLEIPIPLGFVDKEGVIAHFNNKFTEVFGYTTGDVPTLDEWWLKAYPDETYRRWVLDKWNDAVAKAAKEGTSVESAEFRVTCKNGAERMVIIGGSPVEGGVLAIFNDITERKRAEITLIESETRFRNLVETTSDWIWEVDENFAFTYVSPKIQDILGHDGAKIIGKTPFDLMTPEEAKRVAGIAGVIAATKNPFSNLENTNLHKDGYPVVIETSGVPIIDTEGKFCGYRGINRDITERKEHEEELKRSNADLEQFSYAVSHDMRQPLRMISSYLQLLEMGLAGQLDNEKRGYFNSAIEGAKRIDQMLVALLEYSRIGRMGEPPTVVDSRAILGEVLQFLQPAIAEAHARLDISGEWPRLMARHDEILRLLQNLIGNAIKYRIAGRTPEITVTSKVVKNEWHLCIADNGVGIIPDQIKRLFQVFQRLQSREAYEGTGIGLALCRKIAEHHKGRIWAESAGEGQGSKFYVVLPVLQMQILSQ
jgi:PAS domain S-box-containing protein